MTQETGKKKKKKKKKQRGKNGLYKDHLIPKNIYQNICPIGSQRPQLYSLKIYKPNVSLWTILSMVGSGQHCLAELSAGTLEPVLKLYPKHCIYD